MERRASGAAVFALVCCVRRFWEAIIAQLKTGNKKKSNAISIQAIRMLLLQTAELSQLIATADV